LHWKSLLFVLGELSSETNTTLPETHVVYTLESPKILETIFGFDSTGCASDGSVRLPCSCSGR